MCIKLPNTLYLCAKNWEKENQFKQKRHIIKEQQELSNRASC